MVISSVKAQVGKQFDVTPQVIIGSCVAAIARVRDFWLLLWGCSAIPLSR